MTKITIGSIVVGASGKKLIVDRVEGDIIYSGELRIKTSAVVKVIPPNPVKFKLGDRVVFIGDEEDERLFSLSYGEILDVIEDCGEWVKTRTSGKKPILIPRVNLEVA